jgi:hypothetical protein
MHAFLLELLQGFTKGRVRSIMDKTCSSTGRKADKGCVKMTLQVAKSPWRMSKVVEHREILDHPRAVAEQRNAVGVGRLV